MYDLKRYVESTYKFNCSIIDLQHINYLTYHSTSEKFVEYIIQNISVDKIKEALKVAITNMYEEDNEISVD